MCVYLYTNKGVVINFYINLFYNINLLIKKNYKIIKINYIKKYLI